MSFRFASALTIKRFNFKSAAIVFLLVSGINALGMFLPWFLHHALDALNAPGDWLQMMFPFPVVSVSVFSALFWSLLAGLFVRRRSSEAKTPEQKKRLLKIAAILTSFVVLWIAVSFYLFYKTIWEFDRLEDRAKKAITAAELQNWATNLLAKHPESGQARLSSLGTNFPVALRGLAPKLGPSIYVYEASDAEHPAWVRIFWGSGFLGHCSFEIGATNFVGGGHPWQDGVYFWNENDPE